MNKLDMNAEAMVEILANSGVEIPVEKVSGITEDFIAHLDMCRESENYDHISRERRCDDCANSKARVLELEKEIQIYQNSVKTRRNAATVWTEDGLVRYE